MKKPAAWLALLLSCLIALPPAVLADDTELFTTSANPNVLLILDTSLSMNTQAGSSSVGDLDGEGNSNSRMDILWKVVYTLLNADLSIPSSSSTITATLDRARRWNSWTIDTNISSSRTYQYVQVNTNGATWAQFPGSTTTGGTVIIGSGGQSENMTYTSRSSGSPYRFYFSSAKSFSRNYNQGSIISYTYTPSYSENYPTTNSEATGTDFLNNLTTADEDILKARLGLMTFSGTVPSNFRINIRSQIDSGAPNSPPFTPSYQDIWNSVTTYAHLDLYTPTAKTLNSAQTFFSTAYNSSQVCRPNFAVLITDGEDTMGGIDGATSGVATYYHNDNPSYTFYPDGCTSFNGSHICTGSGQGQVARHNAVIQEAANLTTYNPSVKLFAVGVGINGNDPDLRVQREVLRRATEQLNAQATNAQYTAVGASGDNTSRGAGRTFFATDATELSIAMRNIFHQISAGSYAFTAPTVASVRMTDRNYLYKASFAPATPPATFWEGHLEALTINDDNTYTSHWDADNVLKSTASSSRRIYTSDNTWTRRDFTTSYITAAMLGVDNDTARDNVVNYVRGEGHDNNAKLGDVFHSKPIVVGPPSRFFFDEGYSTEVGASQSFADAKATRKRVIFVGTNDGMLHAFLSGTYNTSTELYDSGTGEELFGFVPYSIQDQLINFLPGDLTTHGYFADSSARVADVWIDGYSGSPDGVKQSSEWRTVLISGLRKGGNSYFALDVTDPPSGTDYTNYPKVLWEYTAADNVGQTWSEPFIGRVRMKDTSTSDEKDRWVAIFGGGMADGGTVGKSLVVLDIATGTALKTFATAAGIDNVIPASPTAVLDASGYIKFAYVNDLDGSLYKFDFRTTGVRSDGFSAWTVHKIFQPSAGQPVYHRVEPGTIDESTRYLFFGTGNQEFPVSDGGTGKFYAIKDTDSSTTLLTESNLADLSSSITSLTGGTVGSSQYGWFVSFASVPSTANDTYTHSKEKVLSDPVIFYNNVYFTTFTPDASNPCSGGGIARVYGLQMLNAGSGLAAIAARGETSTSKVPYHVYTGSEGGIPSSPSLSIYPTGQSSIFVGFSTGSIQEIKIESPLNMKTIKSWKEMF
jgi:type IV pilus assembly protein PilY1